MHSLIISIIAIALTSAALYSGINYIDFNSYDAKVSESVIINDMYSYSMGIDSYKNMYNVYPSNASWEDDLERLHLMLPNDIENNYFYNYDTAVNSVAICYTKTVNANELKPIKEVHSKGMTIMSDSCFQKTNKNVETGTYPVTIALTQWIKHQ